MTSSKVLKLTLKKAPFEVMQTGEKLVEFRKPTDWIKSRLYNKDGTERDYDDIEFINGYGANRPKFKAVFCGIELVEKKQHYTYSNGLQVITEVGDIMICFLLEQQIKELNYSENFEILKK